MTAWEDPGESALVEAMERTARWMAEPPAPPCSRCGTTLVDVEWADVRTMGDLEPRHVLCAGRCPREGCGTTCPICRRPVGDIHSGACSPFVLTKLTDPCRVSVEDCDGAPSRSPPPDTSWIEMETIRW